MQTYSFGVSLNAQFLLFVFSLMRFFLYFYYEKKKKRLIPRDGIKCNSNENKRKSDRYPCRDDKQIKL